VRWSGKFDDASNLVNGEVEALQDNLVTGFSETFSSIAFAGIASWGNEEVKFSTEVNY
jgi:hypothetical protein